MDGGETGPIDNKKQGPQIRDFETSGEPQHSCGRPPGFVGVVPGVRDARLAPAKGTAGPGSLKISVTGRHRAVGGRGSERNIPVQRGRVFQDFSSGGQDHQQPRD